MLHLNRTTEYALLALTYLWAPETSDVVSVGEIADHYSIPQVLLSKVMQRLGRGGFVRSIKGRSGGYTMACDPVTVPLVDLFSHMDESLHLVACLKGSDPRCDRHGHCDILGPLTIIEKALKRSLAGVYLAHVLGSPRTDRPRLKARSRVE